MTGQQRRPDFLSIEFVIVGGATAGLSAAIALTRVGHKVTVLDSMPSFDETPIGAGCRIPPNATKLFYRWGMEDRLRKWALKSRGILFAKCNDLDVPISSHNWEDEVLGETGGDFLMIHYDCMRRILAESAAEHGATLRSECKVVKVTPDAQRPSVTLSTGEVVTGDVIIGADGCYVPEYHMRKLLLEALEEDDAEQSTGMQLFNAVVPDSALTALGDESIVQQVRESGKVFTWYGPGYGALGFPIRDPKTAEPMFALFVYAAYWDENLSVHLSTKEQLTEVLKGRDPRLVKVAEQADRITSIPMVNRPFLEDWVHPDGRVIVIGEAAHPIPVGSLYAPGMAVGDSAVLGRLFAHLHRHDQIDFFLNAVPEIRLERVKSVMRAASGNIFAVSLPPGVADGGDGAQRARAVRGIQELSVDGMSAEPSAEMIQAVESIFAYDPEDEADDWWVQWGLMQERMARLVVVDTPSVHIDEHSAQSQESP
ncbi:FAD/NAD-P-binding domain-containing protein [Trametes maxima]|nr:FAD/NAD-P-binding domain-containing protein [Trametes maxima]